MGQYMNNQYTNNQSIDTLLAEYISGTLTRPAKVLMDAHMEILPDSRRWAQDLEALAGYSLDTGAQEEIADRASMLSTIFDAPEKDSPAIAQLEPVAKSDEWMPASLRNFVGLSAKEIPWRMKIPGVHTYKMADEEGCEVMLLRIKPGVSIPTHTHEGRELTLVLKGSFRDGTGNYERGGVSVADHAVDHKPIAGLDEECICFVVNDAPLRFTGPVARIISSILPR